VERTKILLVDDDRKLCRLVEEYLAPMGYDVTSVFTGQHGLAQALSGDYQAVILDVMLPDLDGFEVLKRLRRESNLPVLMLTSRGDETDRIVGLEIGADDYLPKTFSSRELLARLRAVTRRATQTPPPPSAKAERPLVFAELRIEPSSRTVILRDAPLELTPLEFDLLLALARAAGRVLTRDQLLDAVAGRDYEVFDRSIDVHISYLRRKLGDDPKEPRFIKTVRAAGYMFLDGPAGEAR
jgi:two-component system response regulator CpxR